MVYVFDSKTGELRATLENPPEARIAGFGSVLATGDADADGQADIGVASTAGAPWQPGLHVFSGSTGELLSTVENPRYPYEIGFGRSLGLADLNGDGASDVIAGAPLEDVSPLGGEGRVYILALDNDDDGVVCLHRWRWSASAARATTHSGRAGPLVRR